MLVGFNLKGENKHRTVTVDTDDHKIAIATARDHYKARGIVRMFALIIGGKHVQESK